MTAPLPTSESKERVGRDDWVVISVFTAGLAAVLAVIGIGFGLRAIDEAGGGTVDAAGAGAPITVDVELGDL
jgi:hypothetical protein